MRQKMSEFVVASDLLTKTYQLGDAEVEVLKGIKQGYERRVRSNMWAFRVWKNHIAQYYKRN